MLVIGCEKGKNAKLDMLLFFAAHDVEEEPLHPLVYLCEQVIKHSIERNTISATPICLPIYLPSIFCFFLEGALGLADPYVPFLFIGFSFDHLSKTALISSKAPD